MDNTALYKLSYGVFMLASKDGDKVNGCITNTCMQVASNPVRVAISVLNTNYTCDIIRKSGKFALTMLSKDCTFDTIKFFGMQSGRSVNKFEFLEPPTDINGIPYLDFGACAVLSGNVVESHDLGTHTLFIAEVVDAKKLADTEPMTYAYYQSDVKPRPAAVPAAQKKIKAWKCKICGYVFEGEKLPKDFVCPLCGHDAGDFEPVYED